MLPMVYPHLSLLILPSEESIFFFVLFLALTMAQTPKETHVFLHCYVSKLLNQDGAES